MELDGRFWAFVLLSTLLIVTPGPDTALIIRNALSSGPRASTFSAVGVAVGTLAWTTAAALGVGVLLEQSSMAFTVLKLVGAAYLCYLGLRSLLSRRPLPPSGGGPAWPRSGHGGVGGESHPLPPSGGSPACSRSGHAGVGGVSQPLPPSGGGPAWPRSGHAGVGGFSANALRDPQAFGQGLLSNILNPKTGAFFVTVLPQFLVAGDPPLRLVIMVAAYEAILLVWLIAYGHAVSRAGRSRLGGRVRVALTRLSGLVLIGLGARLAFERR